MSVGGTRLWRWFGAFALYSVIAVLLTWPATQQFSTHVAGFLGRDSLQYTWSLWWSRQAWQAGQSPAEATLIYRPWQPGNVLLGVAPMLDWLAYPLYAMLTPTQVYNTLFLVSLALSGLTMYWLAFDRTGHTGGALLAGAVYAFAAPRMGHALLGHLTHLAAWWFPLSLLFGLRALDRPRWRDAALCGLFAGLQALVAPIQAAYLVAPGLALVFAFEALRRRRVLTRRHLLAAALCLAVAAVVVLPTYGPLLADALRHGLDLSAEGVEGYSVDAAMVLMPSPYHPLWGRLVQRLGFVTTIIPEDNDLEHIAYLGFLPLALAVYGWLRNRNERWPWLALLLVALVLAMGPELVVAGRRTGVPLPYAFLSRLPLLSWGRTPERYMQLSMCGAGLLAAYGMAEWRPRWWIATGVLAAFVLGAITMWPFPDGTPKPPTQVAELGQQKGVVLDLPNSKRQIGNLAMYYQTSHGLPIIGGYIHRDPPGQRDYVKALDRAILKRGDMANRRLTPAELRALLQGLGVQHVLVHRDFVTLENVREASDRLVAALGTQPEDWGAVLAFTVPDAGPPRAADAQFCEGLALRVLSVQAQGGAVQVALSWQSDERPSRDWTVYVHLLNEAGALVAQDDSQPSGGNLPMTFWAPEQVVLDEHLLTVGEAEDLVRKVVVGLYDADTGDRCPAVAGGLIIDDGAVAFPLPE